MTTSNLVRTGAVRFVLSGALTVVQGVLFLALHALNFSLLSTPIANVFFGTSSIVGVLALLVGLVGLHVLQRGSYGHLGATGFYTILVALVVIGPLSLIALYSASPAFGWLVEPLGQLGVLTSTVGFVMLGLATARAGVLPRWSGVALMVAAVAFMLPFGQVLAGLIRLAPGYILWIQENAPIGRTEPR